MLLAASVSAGVFAASYNNCDGDLCGDLRPVLNPPFPMALNAMFYPEEQLRAAARNGAPLVRAVSTSARRLPQLRPGFIQVQQRAPVATPPKTPVTPATDQRATAPTADNRGLDGWFAECPAGQITGCQIIRRAPGSNGAGSATIIIGPDQRVPGRNQATIVLPLGIAVRESVPMLIDERFVALVPIETCLPAGCVLTVALPPPMVSVLRGATTLKFLVLNPSGQTLVYTLPVAGFGDAYQKVSG